MAQPSSIRTFHQLVNDYFDRTFTRFPIWGTVAGRHEFDRALGRATPETWERQGALIERTLRAIEDLPPQDFDADATLDRRAMLAELRQERLFWVQLRRWAHDPQVHLNHAADAIHMLVVRHGDDLTPAAEAIVSRIRALPKYLDEGAECLSRPEPLWKRLALAAAPDVCSMLEALEDPLVAAGKRRATVRRAIDAACSAVDGYRRHLQSLRPAAAGTFAVGHDALALIVRERLGLPMGPLEVAAMARRHAENLREALRSEARRFHARKPALEILGEAARQWEPEGRNLPEAYAKMMRHVRERFKEAGWVTFPKGDRLLIKPVPDFMRGLFPTAAYSSPGALDPDQTGIFWVNDLSAVAGTEETRRAEIAQHYAIELTCAHEAYPGHHLQFIMQNRLPSLARKMCHHAIYYEGWTLWCEQMSADLPVTDNPYLRLTQLHDELWRAWRIVIDVGLQTGELSIDAAVGLLQREVGFTEARARGDVNWYTGMPGVPMSYLLGKMELLRLKHQRVDRGGMTLRAFNDWVLTFGAIPWRWIEECG